MKRARAFLFALVTGAAACSDSGMQQGIPPWHMWGDTQTVTLTNTTPGRALSDSKQLVQIIYARPETWRFFFSCKLLAGQTSSPAAIFVHFNVTFGLGRSTVSIPNFVVMRFNPGIGVVVPSAKWTNNTNGPLLDDSLSATPPQNVIDSLVAQTIQVEMVVNYQSSLVGDHVQVETAAFFAPDSHVRPEWFTRVAEFPGGENKGH